MKMRRKEKIIILLALTGAAALGIWLIYSWLYIWPEKAIQRELAKIRARGEPVTLEELAPPEIPGAENAALIYEQALAVYYEPSRENGINLGKISGKDPATWTEEDIAAIREDLQKNKDCLHLLHQAANFDKSRFPIDYTLGLRILLPHLSKMRNFARLLARDATLRAREGKIEEALESTRAGLRLRRGFLDEPILTSQLVRFAIDSLMFTTLQRILEENDASPEILRRLLKELDIEKDRAAFARSLQGERCFQIDTYEKMIKDPALLAQMRSAGVYSSPPTISKAFRIMASLARPVFRRDEIFALGIMQRMIEAAKLPYHQAKADLGKIDQDILNAPRYRTISKMLLPAITRAHLQEAQHEARIGLAQLALALKIYKAEKGKYPDRLDDLVPEILPELPKDPFTGKDFVYKREGEGFLVYSLGENETDEGGKWEEKNPYQHDIPWRCKR